MHNLTQHSGCHYPAAPWWGTMQTRMGDPQALRMKFQHTAGITPLQSPPWVRLGHGDSTGMALPSQSLMVGTGHTTLSHCVCSATLSWLLLIVNQQGLISPQNMLAEKWHQGIFVKILVKISQTKSWGEKIFKNQRADFPCSPGMGAHSRLAPASPALSICCFPPTLRGCITSCSHTVMVPKCF